MDFFMLGYGNGKSLFWQNYEREMKHLIFQSFTI